jgi:hypothetical protein
MTGYRPFIAIATLALTLEACDDNPSSQPFGSMDITTSAPDAEKDIVTADGWTVHYDRFLVHFSAVEVAGADGVIATSSDPQIVDQVEAGPKSILSASLRSARAWENVSFQIGPAARKDPAAADAVEIGLVGHKVTPADRDLMQASNLSVYVEGKLTKAAITKTFKWGFTTDTSYADCREPRGATVLRGLVVPPNGNDTANVAMTGGGLFSDALTGAGTLHADAIASADANNDGDVTLDELHAVTLDAARAGGGAYTEVTEGQIPDLGEFVSARVPALVTSFRAAGTCTATAPASDTASQAGGEGE